MADSDIHQHIAERLLEDESLTADLIDDAAKRLLDWGLAQAMAEIQQAEDIPQEELDARLAELRRTMKRVSRRAGRAAPDDQAEQVQALLTEIEATRAQCQEEATDET